jgi:hypothetical protein
MSCPPEQRSEGTGRCRTYPANVERPPADPAKLLASWMEWEKGETPPGRVMSNLKTGGLRDVLEHLAAQAQEADTADA